MRGKRSLYSTTDRDTTGGVQRYYDTNTPLFLLTQRGGPATIHRELWLAGVYSKGAARDAIHREVARYLPRPVDRPHYLDVGCGVGASGQRIARLMGAVVTGITISAGQAAYAARHFPEDEVRVVVGDFTTPRPYRGLKPSSLDGAWMIESLVHATNPERVFHHLHHHLKRSARLVIVDDLWHDIGTRTPRAVQRMREEFTLHWNINTLCTRERIVRLARRCGFSPIAEEDYTPFQRDNSRVSWSVAHGAKVFRSLSLRGGWIDNIRGGAARAALARAGYLRYTLLVFELAASSPTPLPGTAAPTIYAKKA